MTVCCATDMRLGLLPSPQRFTDNFDTAPPRRYVEDLPASLMQACFGRLSASAFLLFHRAGVSHGQLYPCTTYSTDQNNGPLGRSTVDDAR